MAKFQKAKWIATHPGGGVHIQGFVERKQEVIQDNKGRRKILTDRKPVSITVIPSREEEEVEVTEYGSKHILELGDFIVQDNVENRKVLKHFVLRGDISLDDFELQCEMEGVEIEQDEYEEIDTSKEVTYSTPKNSIAAKEDRTKAKSEHFKTMNEKDRSDKLAEIAPFECLTNIKIGREHILLELVNKGIKSLDDLAEVETSVLLSIKGVGEKLALQLKEQATELTVPKE